MKCYRCNSRLSDDRNVCPKCGADVRLYRKVIHASNQYYNLGLERAKARDLTGAAESLRVSLQLYKRNISARNLLGLVYYEMGEGALALKEWVISKNFRHRANAADGYIQELRENRQALDSADHSLKKFNQALEYAKTGSKDMALIQLKKVISVNRRMLKAYVLLALLYMEDGKWQDADTVITRCLEIDRGNPQALTYQKEIKKHLTGKKQEIIGVAGELEREEVIIPVRMHDWGSYLTSAMFILMGFLLALGVLYFIIMPGTKAQYEKDSIGQVSAYENRYLELNRQIEELETQLAALESDRNSIQSDLQNSSRQALALQDAYGLLLDMAELYVRGDYETFADEFPKLTGEEGRDYRYQSFYQLLKADYDMNICARLLQLAVDARENTNPPDREKAVELCDKILEIDPEYDTALFYKALCTEELGRKEEAAAMYLSFVTTFPDSDWVGEVRSRMQALSSDDTPAAARDREENKPEDEEPNPEDENPNPEDENPNPEEANPQADNEQEEEEQEQDAPASMLPVALPDLDAPEERQPGNS